MNRARFVHDQLELAGWPVAIADAQKVKGLARWPPRPTGSTPGSSRAVPPRPGPEIWLPTPRSGPSGTRPMAMSPGPPPHRAPAPPPRHPAGLRHALSDQRPVRRRRPPAPGQTGAAQPCREPGRGPGPHRRPGRPAPRLRTRPSAPRRRSPLCAAAHDRPRIAWVLGYIAAELGDIARFPSPRKLCGDTGLCPGSTSPSAATSTARWPSTARRTGVGR